MSISISIHVDGYYGLVNGVPNLLKLFDKYGIKTTFFVNMGYEANIFQILKYRKNSRISNDDKNIINRYSKKQMIGMLLLNRKLGSRHHNILKKIEDAGHEVNPHSWSHLLWSKNFNKLDKLREIQKMKKSFIEIFGKSPIGFAPPTWKFNDDVINSLKKEGFKYLGVNDGSKKVSDKNGIKIIPLSFGKNIEELLNEGKQKKEILSIFNKETSKNYVNLYFHADFEGLAGISIFESILKMIDCKKIKTYEELLK